MTTLNDYITKARESTTTTTGVPIPDRTQQTDFGMGLVQRMAQRSEQPLEVPKPMPPIVPIAN